MPGDRGQHCIYDSPLAPKNTCLKTFSYQVESLANAKTDNHILNIPDIIRYKMSLVVYTIGKR